MAIEVMNAIAAQTGAKLPITALFEYPTIAGLATLIEGKEAAKQTLWKCLVPIKPHGNKPPLYIVHGNGLTVMVFHGLAKHLHPEQPVYGLQARGLDNVDEAQNNMEEIALTYINEILEHNPNGPYCLAGYSFGGIVAFEMAKQLTAMGKKVNMVGIFDTYAGNNDRFLSPVSRLFKKLFRQIPKLLFVISSYIKHPSAIAEYQRYLFNKRFRGIDSEAADPSQKLPNEDHILSLHDEAMYNYRLSPYKGRIDLFRAQLRVYFLDDLTYLGWQPYAQKGVQIHEVPGDHKTLFFPPLDAQVAAIVQKVLDERNRV
ncbi:MAG: hypothetical protein EBX41_04335 [Chitinophagia bacterium]|nr:hypothetical protein [Chitinophagia bacterium]